MNATQLLHSKPTLNPHFRLQWETAQHSHVLLYPEGMVKLNRSAGEILSRCTGMMTTEQIVSDLETQFGRNDLGDEVARFLTYAIEQEWIVG
jgi:pyrroloquinoline quinone biosynthesis protein D